MDRNKLKNLLKIILLVSLLFFLICYSYYGTNDCQQCSFEVEEENLSYKEFLEVYEGECFDQQINDNFSEILGVA